MTFDVDHHLGAVTRSVAAVERDGHPGRAVTLTRSYDTTPDDLWEALTSPERLPRWFAPVDGDFRPGGRFQITGNASGTVTACEPPSRLALTWEFGGDVSWVDVHVAAEEGNRARLTLTHTARLNDHWVTYGPGAVGVGWELGLLGLAMHIAEPAAERPDENTFAASPEGASFMIQSSDGWADADIAAGQDPDLARAAAGRTAAFYTGQSLSG